MEGVLDYRDFNRTTPCFINYFSDSEREYYLHQHGSHPLAYSTLQKDLYYFDMPGIGYIAFAVELGTKITLGEPVCHPENFSEIIAAFIRLYPNAVFIQVGRKVSRILKEQHGYYTTPLGSETKVPLKNWNTRGKHKKSIRMAVNQAKKQGIAIREVPEFIECREVSERWIKTRPCKKEVHFLVRPASMTYSRDIRYFYAFRDDEPVGYIMFDPIYEQGRIKSYIPNISRASTDFKQGIWYAIQVHAMEKFKEEGFSYIDLGLSPLTITEPFNDSESRFLRIVLEFLYCYGNSIYNFKGLGFTKKRFQGEMASTFIGHRYNVPLISLLATIKVCKVF